MRAETHLRLSLAMTALFLALGLGLEAMYGLRGRRFMDDAIMREMLRLGHAHGAILGLLNVALGWGLERLGTPEEWASRVRAAAWTGALVVGLAFVGGGLWHGPTDPGPVVLAVPAGALMLLGALAATAWIRGERR